VSEYSIKYILFRLSILLIIKFYVPRSLQNIDRTETGSATFFYTHVEKIYSLPTDNLKVTGLGSLRLTKVSEGKILIELDSMLYLLGGVFS
jgi:hypothetical protein